jgi:hypothetical protein
LLRDLNRQDRSKSEKPKLLRQARKEMSGLIGKSRCFDSKHKRAYLFSKRKRL